MPSPPSSPPSGSSSAEESLAYYKSQYEQLELELAEFQASSQELEAELEKDVEASEKRERLLKEKVEALGYEVDEWKVGRSALLRASPADRVALQTKHKQSKAEANAAQNTLQREITTLRDSNRTMQLKLRDIEVANDDFERQARNTTSSLEDLESKYNVAIERAVMLEAEIQVGEQEREALRIETQRLRDELSDLKIEADITQGKLRDVESAKQREYGKPQLLTGGRNQAHSPTSDRSLVTSASSPTVSTPPRPKSASTSTSDAATPPSPPTSEASAVAATTTTTTPNPPAKSSPREGDSNTTPRPSHFPSRPPRHSRGPSIPVSNGRGTPSMAQRATTNKALGPRAPGAGGLASSGSLRQVRGLITQVQRLEQRVHSARSKLPAPVSTPPGASPRSGSALGHSFIPASVTVRSPKKRTGGSNASAASSVRGSETTTPLSTRHVSRLSYGGPGPAAEKNGGSRPSSRASVSSRSSINPAGGYQRPSSRASLSGARTPLGHHAAGASTADARRPRSSVGGSYASVHGHGHGHGHSASVGGFEDQDDHYSTPTPRRSLLSKSDLEGSGIPTPSGLPRRQSGGAILKGFGQPMASSRRTSSGMTHRDTEGEMGPPERRRKLSGVGETH
ncbi:MAG: NADH:ubiquinone oxidoreductase [Thelocarpon impressellum]|nr:MAG: NADH:ubiquinone oxidoreductase [Thelocarpon impressellum]